MAVLRPYRATTGLAGTAQMPARQAAPVASAKGA